MSERAEEDVVTRTGRSTGDQRGLEALVWAVLGLGAVALAQRLVDAVRGEPIKLTADLPDRVASPAAGSEAPLTGTVVLDAPTAGQQVLALLPALLVAVQVVADLTRHALLSGAGVLGPDVVAAFTLPLWPLAAGLLVAFLAEVFARGSVLRDEVEGPV